MNNLWEEKRIKEDIIKLYFIKKYDTRKILGYLRKKYNLKALSNTKIKKDIGRIIHRRSQDLKLNRQDEAIGNCPVCGKKVFFER